MIRALVFTTALLCLFVPVVSAQFVESTEQRQVCVTLYAFDYDIGPIHVGNADNIRLVCVYCPDDLDFWGECREQDSDNEIPIV